MGEEFRRVSRAIITGLSAKTTYSVWMTASTARKEGAKSNIITVQTCKKILKSSTSLYISSSESEIPFREAWTGNPKMSDGTSVHDCRVSSFA